MPKKSQLSMIALDTETTGLDLRHGCKPFLVTTCDNGGNQEWWEWAVDPLNRKPKIPAGDLVEIQEVIDRADTLVLQNAKFDVAALQSIFKGKLRWDWEKTEDTLYAGHLLASNQPHDLTTMALVYLNINVKPYEDNLREACNKARRIARKDFPEWRIAHKDLPEMPSAGATLWKYDMWLLRALAQVTPAYGENHSWRTMCSDYANSDSETTMALWLEQKKRLKEKGLWKIYQERRKLLPIVYQMEKQGITVNRARLEELVSEYTEESARCGQTCVNIARDYGADLVLPKSGNNKSLLSAIFDSMKFPTVLVSKKTGAPSLAKAALDEYEATMPERSKRLSFVRNLKAKRKRDTALNYMAGYRRFWLSAAGNWYRLHPSLNPTGTDTLRWSSQNPNEQNISKQEGFNLRYCFGPVPGREWWSLDYDNLELRIPAYEAGEQLMIDVFEKPDDPPYFGSYHLMNASIIYPDLFWPLADKKGAFKQKYGSTWYQWCKNFGFAVSYGAVEESGTADRAAHKEGAQRLVMNRLREHTKLNRKMIATAERHGYVETIPDKEVDPKRGYPLWCTRSNWGKISPTIPLNYHVQGTACWITMRAMVKVQEYLNTLIGCYLIMNIHDEIVLDFPFKPSKGNLPQVNRVKRIMESIGDCVDVPLTCGVNYHPKNWSESVSV